MSSPLLNKYAPPAERSRGCVFAEGFENATNLAKNGGTVVGTVPIPPGKGAVYPGTNGNYIWYPCESLLNRSVVNFVVEFWPEYASNDGAFHFFFDTIAPTEYYAVKHSNNGIQIMMGNTALITVANATYAPYWRQYERNVLVISGTTGNTSVYLNGVFIGNSITAWTPANPPILYVGCVSAPVGTLTHNGRMTSVKIFTGNTSADLLSLREARSYWRGGYCYV